MMMKKNQPKQSYYVVEECPACGYKAKRGFRDGDYVFKESGICPKDNTVMYISMIFSEEEKRS